MLAKDRSKCMLHLMNLSKYHNLYQIKVYAINKNVLLHQFYFGPLLVPFP